MQESNYLPLQEILGQTDIYLIDQILKGRYQPTDKILDAGCGTGRNMYWFLKNDIAVYGVDSSQKVLEQCHTFNPGIKPQYLSRAEVSTLPFADHYFDHVISSAVLHFARSESHFLAMMAEMCRVVKQNGSLFIRMASDIGIEHKVTFIKDGTYLLPDGTVRFLLTKKLLRNVLKTFSLYFLEPLKTVNVEDVRCMSTLVLSAAKTE